MDGVGIPIIERPDPYPATTRRTPPNTPYTPQIAKSRHRGRKGDPLYAARKTLLTGTDIPQPTHPRRAWMLYSLAPTTLTCTPPGESTRTS